MTVPDAVADIVGAIDLAGKADADIVGATDLAGKTDAEIGGFVSRREGRTDFVGQIRAAQFAVEDPDPGTLAQFRTAV